MSQNRKTLPRCIPLVGYRHMFRSLIRFYAMDTIEAGEMLYPLYIGNLDTCQYANVRLIEMELTRDGFTSLSEPFARPYYTELQMHRSMNGLLANIRREATIDETRQAVREFNHLIAELEQRFEAIYDCGITDHRTRYCECWGRLTVKENEPQTVFKAEKSCLFRENTQTGMPMTDKDRLKIP